MINFDQLNLNTPLLNALADLEFLQPTPIQEKAYPVVLSGKDVVGVAQTGTGKTFAYLLPVLRKLKFSKQKHPRVLIIVPTRELVLQVAGEIEKLTAYMDVRYQGVFGGTNIKTQSQLVYDGLDILVGTPGRLYDLAMMGTLRLKSVQTLIVDEVDEMLSLGFKHQLLSIFDILPERRQNLMFSATLSEDVKELIHTYFYEPETVEVAAHGTPLDKIEQLAYQVPNFNTKMNLLQHLLKEEDLNKVLVFAGNKKVVDQIHEKLLAQYPDKVGAIHSNKSQNYRINSLKRFMEGEYRLLIATDVAARGLDVHAVSHVVNFDIPEKAADYIHRIGRTGRADKEGTAISFIQEDEEEIQMEIEGLMGKHLNVLEFPEEVQVSKVFLPSELVNPADKTYYKQASLKGSKGAFHAKKEANLKINSGSPSKKRKKGKKTRR